MRNRRLVRVLLSIYPASWRREYGRELADMLLRKRIDVRVVANVVRSGLGERLRTVVPRSMWARAIVAFFLMEGLLGAISATRYRYGPGSRVPDALREFQSPFDYAFFHGVMSVPLLLGGLLGVMVPAAMAIRRWRPAHRASNATALMSAIALGTLTITLLFAAVWLVGGDRRSFVEFVASSRQWMAVALLAAFAVGSSVVLANARPTVDRHQRPRFTRVLASAPGDSGSSSE